MTWKIAERTGVLPRQRQARFFSFQSSENQESGRRAEPGMKKAVPVCRAWNPCGSLSSRSVRTGGSNTVLPACSHVTPPPTNLLLSGSLRPFGLAGAEVEVPPEAGGASLHKNSHSPGRHGPGLPPTSGSLCRRAPCLQLFSGL